MGVDEPNSILQRQVFTVVGIITLVYCVYEIYVAMKLRSLTLLGDGFHNLSDVFSLVVAWFAARFSSLKPSPQFTFGYGRAELLGGLINGCCLLSLCLYVGLECMARLAAHDSAALDESAFAGSQFITVSLLGLVVNTLGVVAFACVGLRHGHSHSHGGHGHSHGHGHGHGRGRRRKNRRRSKSSEPMLASTTGGTIALEEEAVANGRALDDDDGLDDDHCDDHDDEATASFPVSSSTCARWMSCDCGSANLTGVFLHYLGDALSSLLVLILGLVLRFNPAARAWSVYADAVGSMLIVLLVLVTTVPLVRQVSRVLMQAVPRSVATDPLKQALLMVPGVQAIHAFHVWQLVNHTVVGSVQLELDAVALLAPIERSASAPPLDVSGADVSSVSSGAAAPAASSGSQIVSIFARVNQIFKQHGVSHPIVGLFNRLQQ